MAPSQGRGRVVGVMRIDEAVVSLVLSQDANESAPSFSGRHLEHGALIVSSQGASDC